MFYCLIEVINCILLYFISYSLSLTFYVLYIFSFVYHYFALLQLDHFIYFTLTFCENFMMHPIYKMSNTNKAIIVIIIIWQREEKIMGCILVSVWT